MVRSVLNFPMNYQKIGYANHYFPQIICAFLPDSRGPSNNTFIDGKTLPVINLSVLFNWKYLFLCGFTT